MKKKNGTAVKQEMPKGFRLSKEIKDILIKRVCYEKYFDRLKFLLRREKHLFYKVAEFIFPSAARETIRDIYSTLPVTPEIPATGRFNLTDEFNRRNNFQLGGDANLPSTLQQLFWSWKYTNVETDNMRTLGFPNMELHDEKLLSYKVEIPQPNSFSATVPKHCLETSLRKEVADHAEELRAFNEEFDQFHSLVQQSVYGCRSVKQLKEYGDKVYDLLIPIANNLKPACSDVDVADAHAQVEKLL